MTTPPKPRGLSLAEWNLLVLVLEKLCQDSQQQAYDKQRVVNHEVSDSVGLSWLTLPFFLRCLCSLASDRNWNFSSKGRCVACYTTRDCPGW